MAKNKILSIVFMVIYLTLLFFFVRMGLENSEQSTETSSQVVEVVTEVVEKVTPDDYVVDKDKVSFLTRKIIGHFGYNVIMGVFLLLAIYAFFYDKCDKAQYKKYSFKLFLIVITFSLVIAIISELIQLIPAGRSCEIKDMAIDYSGAVLGSLLSMLGFLIFCKKTKGVSEQ